MLCMTEYRIVCMTVTGSSERQCKGFEHDKTQDECLNHRKHDAVHTEYS